MSFDAHLHLSLRSLSHTERIVCNYSACDAMLIVYWNYSITDEDLVGARRYLVPTACIRNT